ncbi:hypothetical protein PENSPDRAFT_172938 [Peniophora sp. CONT]|nr:hypothetical protein PENSPDRAFT_172938 [Peniophora sp. CONT]
MAAPPDGTDALTVVREDSFTFSRAPEAATSSLSIHTAPVEPSATRAVTAPTHSTTILTDPRAPPADARDPFEDTNSSPSAHRPRTSHHTEDAIDGQAITTVTFHASDVSLPVQCDQAAALSTIGRAPRSRRGSTSSAETFVSLRGSERSLSTTTTATTVYEWEQSEDRDVVIGKHEGVKRRGYPLKAAVTRREYSDGRS